MDDEGESAGGRYRSRPSARLAAEVGRSPVTILTPFGHLIHIYAEVIRRELKELEAIAGLLPRERPTRLEDHAARLSRIDPVLVRLPPLVQAAVAGATCADSDSLELKPSVAIPQALPFTLDIVTSTVLTIAELRGSLRGQILELAERHHARSIAVFGSVARGEAAPRSDVDFLVEFEPGSTLLDLIHLSQDLEQLLGRPVDVLSLGALKPRDAAIRAEAIAL